MLAEIVISGIIGAYKAEKITKESEERYNRASKRMAEAKARMLAEEEKVSNAIDELVTRKRGVVLGAFRKFIEVVSELKRVEFDENDALAKLCSNNQLQKIENHYVPIFKVAKSELSDKDIAFAFLFGGFSADGFLFGNLAHVMIKDAKLEAAKNETMVKEARVYREYAETTADSLSILCRSIDMITDVVTKFNVLFLKSIMNAKEMIKERGYDKKKYSVDDRKQLMVLFDLADALNKVVDAPVFGENDKLTGTIMDIIASSNAIYDTYKTKFNNV